MASLSKIVTGSCIIKQNYIRQSSSASISFNVLQQKQYLTSTKKTVLLSTVSKQSSILVPRASVSFGHVVGETESSGSSNYGMSVNHGHQRKPP